MAEIELPLRMWWEERGVTPSYIIKDADTRFTAQFDGILESVGATVKKISRKSPNLNPYAEAWVSTFKRECLDKFVVFGESRLEHICRTYERYYNSVRPHSSLDNEPVGVEKMPSPESVEEKDGVICDVWLGGLLRSYRRAA